MSSANPERVGAAGVQPLSGFRLERLDLLNWGTFHGKVQELEPSGGWALLVGDNGSGKSTAIDALRTLLVPPRILNYNDAAGDGRRPTGRDRTRRSYVRGAWASSSTIDSTTATTQYLRAPGELSAIAAVFTDAAHSHSVTLAQVLWEHEEQIKEVYAIASERKGVRDLLEGHTNTTEIKRAAKRSGWLIEESFAAYSERMRGVLHIPGDKALEVFNRAIGMKEVGDIDAFVRQFMLPAADTFPFIRDTVQPHYRTLMDCWAAIARAQRQIELLRPIAAAADRMNDGEARIANWKHLQDLGPPYFASRHIALLRVLEAELCTALASVEAERRDAATRLTENREERDRVNIAIANTDEGLRLQAIESEMKRANEARRAAEQRRARVEPAANLLGAMAALKDGGAFAAERTIWLQREVEERASSERAEEERFGHKQQQNVMLKIRQDKAEERESVERNRVNIPRDYLALRARVASAAGVSIDEIPFAGELIEVRDEYAEWTGAIERLLRSFGLSLLVPERCYRLVAQFINATSLGMRLQFNRVPSLTPSPPTLLNDRVPGRVSFRGEHPLHMWVANELVRRFNHRCCDSIAELERADYGLTREGLVRDGTRHIKDDREAVNDPSARILGWSTDRKIAALREQITHAESVAAQEGRLAAECARRAESSRALTEAARALLGIEDFQEIDVSRWSAQIIRLSKEKALLERSSERLTRLREHLRDIDAAITAGEEEGRHCDAKLGGIDSQLNACRDKVRVRQHELASHVEYNHETAETAFSDLLRALPPLTVDNVDSVIHSAHQRLQGFMSNEQRRVNEASNEMVHSMTEFLGEFSEYKQTLAPRRDYADGFASVLRRIEDEELPQHRERFETYLSENLVGDLLMLNRRLDEHQQAIDARVDEINAALRDIEYESDTYVQIRLASKPHQEVQEFRRNLRDCFEYGITPAPDDRPRTFERVRTLLEWFQRDPERTQRVTDVRSWNSAGVRELRRVDHGEVNYYSATTGKSGGQKAKLAFTILASALCAQYGLSNASNEAANFRLVVIDEAFSRTDESNSTRAMQLFESLGFQLLIVGPFDAKAKLAVPFVQTIHLASNPAGNSSRLDALTREQVENSEAGAPQPSEAVSSATSTSVADID